MADHPVPQGDDIILPDGTVVGTWNGDDVRDLQKSGVLDSPISRPREVSPAGDETGAGSSFYGDED